MQRNRAHPIAIVFVEVKLVYKNIMLPMGEPGEPGKVDVVRVDDAAHKLLRRVLSLWNKVINVRPIWDSDL